MPDKFVKVATYNQTFEAQLAKNLLENEGIDAMLSGELTADVLPLGQAGASDQIVLHVREEDAQRAAGLLASVAAAKLDEDWEEQTESDVWVCSLCGEPISNRLSVCHSCQTPRESIRAGAPRDPAAIQRDPSTLPTGEEVQQRDEIARTPSAAPVSLSPLEATHEEESNEAPTAANDDRARRAFLASMIGMIALIVLPLAWYYLVRVVFDDGEISPKGQRYLYGALLLNGFLGLLVFGLCAGFGGFI